MTRSKMPLLCLFAVLAIALLGVSLLSAAGADEDRTSSIDQTANDPTGDDDSSEESTDSEDSSDDMSSEESEESEEEEDSASDDDDDDDD